jgi:hypothetical protein
LHGQFAWGSRAYIYTFLPIPPNTIWLSPLPNSLSIIAAGINDWGDVVGGCNDKVAGFFYSASTKEMTGIDSCFLYDINVNRIAVGESAVAQPIMVDLSKANPVPQPLFDPGTPFEVGVALAINSSNTIVGLCDNDPLSFATVYYDGELHDLNTLLSGPGPFHLMDAVDINESGQIVGSAITISGPPQAMSGIYAYIATPNTLPPTPGPSTPRGPVRSWPTPIWAWPWGWLPNPGIPPSQFGPSPMLALASQISRMPITGKRPNFQKLLAAHRARITRRTASKKQSRRKKNKTRR